MKIQQRKFQESVQKINNTYAKFGDEQIFSLEVTPQKPQGWVEIPPSGMRPG